MSKEIETITGLTRGHIVSVSEVNEYKPGQKVLDFRLRTDEAYPQVLEFTLYNKGIELHSDKIEEGNQVVLNYNLKGREYNDRIYHSLHPWSIRVIKAMEPVATAEPENDFDDEDVPF